MGEAFISSKKERFEHARDKEFETELASPNLWSRLMEVTTTVYRCVKSRNVPLLKGEGVLVVDLGDTNVTVLVDNQVIGYVQASDSNKIRAFFANSPHQMLVGRVHSPPKLGNTFTITLDISPS